MTTFPDTAPHLRLMRLRTRRLALIAWLDACIREEDWHGVIDAACDLRETDAEIRGLER